MSRHAIKELTRQLEAANENIKILKDQQREWRDVLDRVFQDRLGCPAILPDFLRLGDSKIEGVRRLAKEYARQEKAFDCIRTEAAKWKKMAKGYAANGLPDFVSDKMFFDIKTSPLSLADPPPASSWTRYSGGGKTNAPTPTKGPRVIYSHMGDDVTHEGLEKSGWKMDFLTRSYLDACRSRTSSGDAPGFFEGIPIHSNPYFDAIETLHFEDPAMPSPTPKLPFTTPNTLAEVMVNKGSPIYRDGGILAVADKVTSWDKERLAVNTAQNPAEEKDKITALSLARLETRGCIEYPTVNWIMEHIPLWPLALREGGPREGTRHEILLDYLKPKPPALKTYGDLDLKPGDRITHSSTGTTHIVADVSDYARCALMAAWGWGGARGPEEVFIVCNTKTGDIGYLSKKNLLDHNVPVTRKDGTPIYPVPGAK
jgi:hypothetical protein